MILGPLEKITFFGPDPLSQQVDPIFLDGWMQWLVEVAYFGRYLA
jgi:hypothetical protein